MNINSILGHNVLELISSILWHQQIICWFMSERDGHQKERGEISRSGKMLAVRG